MKKIASLLLHPVLLAIVGLAAAAAIIWFVGPLIAIANFRPLESETVRWILIGLLVGMWLVRRLWALYKARQKNALLQEGLLKRGPAAPATAPTASEEEVATLNRRFEEAIAVLRKVRISAAGTRPRIADILSLSGRQYLYHLPWYIFIGAPGSGKTTALINSGLQFPLAEKFGTTSIRGVGGTRNCDWWFTDEAVMLDTAGRYTTQESDLEVDSAAWQGFLQLLKKSRPRRPINGVLLTVSVADLLQQGGAEREAHAAAVRARLQELHEQFQIRFPIYVLVTKADLLAGFTEFFSDLGKEERAQVWGMTFPHAESKKDLPLDSFRAEFDLLEQRILDRVLDRMQSERDPVRCAQIFAFPQQLSIVRPLLGDFLERVFAASKFEEAPLIRGVYFTSGTQEGSPIDRVMGTLARAFGMEQKSQAPQTASGRSYFITKFLREVVFAEQGLAGVNLRLERRRNVLRWSVYSVTALLLVGAATAWTLSYSRNARYIDEVEARLPAIRQQLTSLPAADGTTDLVALMPLLDSVRFIATTPTIANGVPTSMSYGMFQGDKLDAAADHAYRRLLHDAFLPRLTLRIEEQLRTANANNLEFAYEALKAYLMLGDQAHFDADAVRTWIRYDWERSLPTGTTNEQRAALEAHLDTLLEREMLATPLPSDRQLVASVRDMLARYPLANRVYSRLKRQGIGSDIPDFTIAKAGGPAAPLVFTRLSGQPLTKGVSSLFTYDGYHKAFKRESEKVANQLADEEDWVLGNVPQPGQLGLADPAARVRLIEDVRRLYLADYAKTWEDFLNDVKLVRVGTLEQTIDVTRLLSAPDNPLVPFLRAASRETTLMTPESEKSVTDKAAARIAEETRRLGAILGSEGPARPAAPAEAIESIVDRRFESLRRYVTSPVPGQPAPIDGTVTLMGELHTLLNAVDTALKAKTALPPSEVPNKVKTVAPTMPEPLRSVVQSLGLASARLAGGAIVSNTNEAIQAQVGDFCRQAIAGRYPLVRSSTRDATQDDFAALFAPGGKMDDFFQRNLATLVDTSTSPWSFRRLNDVAIGSPASLVEFQRAQVIRDVFFRGGARSPGLRLEFKPLEMDAAINQFILDVDGQLVRYSHGPQVPQTVTWPGPRGSTQVRVQIQPPGPSGQSGVTTEGPWALFRMLDKVAIAPTSVPERFHVTFSVDGRNAQFEITASSVKNPFRLRELEQFRCP